MIGMGNDVWEYRHSCVLSQEGFFFYNYFSSQYPYLKKGHFSGKDILEFYRILEAK